MKKITTWSPDTCKCVIEYEWDTDDPPENRQHRVVSHVGCEHHKELSGVPIEEHHVHKENVKKNRAWNLVVGHLDTSHDNVGWKFDEQRILHLTLPFMKSGLKSDIERHLADNGHGDVVVHV